MESNFQKCVLLVEDDEDILDSIKELLESVNYNVECASNGQEALKILRSQRPLPALILLDLMMPIMNGYKFLEEQDKDPMIAKIPVLVMTAHGQFDLRKPITGAKGYLKKPLELDSFLDTVKRLCS